MQATPPDVREPHRRTGALVDVVLGGQDGLVNVLGVLLGVAAATGSSRVVLAAGIAGALAESISMAAVAYTTAQTQSERYSSERARELRHIEIAPKLERDEIRSMYAARGFSGALLDQVVDTITANKTVWVELMMAEEHRLQEIPQRAALRSAAVVGVSALIGSAIPLVPFLLLSTGPATAVSLAVAALTLFAFGAYKARVTVGHPLRGGLQLAAIGIASALAGYGAGRFFEVPNG